MKKLIYILILTVLSQIGGLVYLIYKLIKSKWIKRSDNYFLDRLGSFGLFLGLYCLCSFLIVPPLAQLNSRVPMPISSPQTKVQPANWLYILLNRHYVKPALKQMILDIGTSLKQEEFPFMITYLDANFPFWDGFALIPHLSHHDGLKIDLCYLYTTPEGIPFNQSPNWLGYGHYEKPIQNELHMPNQCRQEGYWWYNFLSYVFPKSQQKIQFDEAANQQLLRTIAAHPKTQKIFIEPHLKKRLKLNRVSQIRFHGCHAIRHDDHIHLQIEE